jgi:hypothetical protein
LWQPPRTQAGCRDCGTHGDSRAQRHVHRERAAMARTGRVQRTASLPLHPRSFRGLEAEPVQRLLDRDLPANCLEVDTGHGCSSLADGVVGCSRTVPFPFISIGGTERSPDLISRLVTVRGSMVTSVQIASSRELTPPMLRSIRQSIRPTRAAIRPENVSPLAPQVGRLV